MCHFLTCEEGSAAMEYSLFLSLIGVAIAGSVQFLGGSIMEALSFLDAGLGSSNLQGGTK